jgi:hypothetical protein
MTHIAPSCRPGRCWRRSASTPPPRVRRSRGVGPVQGAGRGRPTVEAACRAGGARRIKVETAERLCRMLLRVDPRTLYGEAFDAAWRYRGKRIDARVAAFDLCFSSPKSVSLLAPVAAPHAVRRSRGTGDGADCRSRLPGSQRGRGAPRAQRDRPLPGRRWTVGGGRSGTHEPVCDPQPHVQGRTVPDPCQKASTTEERRQAREAKPLVAEADGNRTRLSRGAAHTGFEDQNHSANNCIASKDTGYPNRRMGKSRVMSTFQDVANDVSVPASVPA